MDSSKFKILIDSPSLSPVLGYNNYAKAFSDIIKESSPQFSIGIFGRWGSGKTTLMEAIQKQLDIDKVVKVDFSAWRYEKEEHLIIPLLATIRDTLIKWSIEQDSNALKDIANQTVIIISKVITSLVAGINIKFGIPKTLQISLDANKALSKASELDSNSENSEDELSSIYHTCFVALKDAFDNFLGKDSKRRIVIFVDDLDRCLPEGVLQVLESMKLFFDLYGFVFVVGVDQDVVEWCIDSIYSNNTNEANQDMNTIQIRGADYIKKIFQVPFSLFPVSITQLDEFLEALITENSLPDIQANDIRENVKPHLEYVITDAGLNPREIKRFINAYTLNLKIKPELNQCAILALKTIAFRKDWYMVEQALLTYGDIFQSTVLRQIKYGDAMALEGLHPDLNLIPQTFLAYVSEKAPGHHLLLVSPLDDYIRSGAATSSGSDPEILNIIKDLGDCRILLIETTKQEYLEETLNRIHQSLSNTITKIENLNRRLGPVESDVLSRCRTIIKKTIPNAVEAFKKPASWIKWRKKFDVELNSALSTLIKMYQSQK